MRTTPAAAATTASATSRRHRPRAGSRCRSRSSRTSACARRTTSSPIPAGGACAPARRSSPPARCGAASRRKGQELWRRRVPAVHVGPRGLLHPVVRDQALLVERRRGAWVAAVPPWSHPELVQRPVDRAAQPRLRRVHAQVEVDEVLLEGPRALLLDWAV